MQVIEDFMSEYSRQFDFWEASARKARELIEVELASSGLRAIVTSRAKSVDRLYEKLVTRAQKSPYLSSAAIQQDIVDLAGVRVALYFPGQMEEVAQIISKTLTVNEERVFPAPADSKRNKTPSSQGGNHAEDSESKSSDDAHLQRFSGYGARHFRTTIPKSKLGSSEERYSSALIEVQVASVLMHAWSEVEHDLVYKPLEGALSASEHALLDQLNGLVLAGEIALEQLQKAGDLRIATAASPFRHHYELAEYLRTQNSKLGNLNKETLGRVDVLFKFLLAQNLATKSALDPYLDRLVQDFESRPVADQLADLMLSGDQKLYSSYLRALSETRHPSSKPRSTPDTSSPVGAIQRSIDQFIGAWATLEQELDGFIDTTGAYRRGFPGVLDHLQDDAVISQPEAEELRELRRVRNRLLHGRDEQAPYLDLESARARLIHLTNIIRRELSRT